MVEAANHRVENKSELTGKTAPGARGRHGDAWYMCGSRRIERQDLAFIDSLCDTKLLPFADVWVEDYKSSIFGL